MRRAGAMGVAAQRERCVVPRIECQSGFVLSKRNRVVITACLSQSGEQSEDVYKELCNSRSCDNGKVLRECENDVSGDLTNEEYSERQVASSEYEEQSTSRDSLSWHVYIHKQSGIECYK